MPQLVLITNHFPYGLSQESFLEQEFPFLSSAFSKITIISRNVIDSSTRHIPKNVNVLRFNNTSSWSEKLLLLFRILPHSRIFFNHFVTEFHALKQTYQLKRNFNRIKFLLHKLAKGWQFYYFLLHNLEISADQVFYTYWYDSPTYSLTLLKKKYPQITAISRTHRVDLYFEANILEYLPLRQITTPFLDGIFFISKNGKEYFIQKTKLGQSNLFISRLGVDNHYNTAHTRKDPKKIYLVSCSWLKPVKRVDLIIDALSLIKDKNIQWTHLGGGPLHPQLIQKAKEKLDGLKNITYTFAGEISNIEVYEYYQKNYVHIFINVSSSEGIPVSIMEAMSFGIPVIATDVGGHSEIIDGTNGTLLVADPEPEEVRNAILTLTGDPDYPGYRTNAKKTWESEYHATKNYIAFTDEILLLLKSSHN